MRRGWEGADCQVSSLTMETAVKAAAVFVFHAIFTPLFPPLANLQGYIAPFAGHQYVLLEVVKVSDRGGKDKSDKGTLEEGQVWVYKRRNVIKKERKKGDKDFTGRIYTRGTEVN